MKTCQYINNYAIIRLLEIMNIIKVNIVINRWEEIKAILPIYSILTVLPELGGTTIYILFNKMKLRNIKLPYLLIYTRVDETNIPTISKDVKLPSLRLVIGGAKNVPRNIEIKLR